MSVLSLLFKSVSPSNIAVSRPHPLDLLLHCFPFEDLFTLMHPQVILHDTGASFPGIVFRELLFP